MGVRFGFLGQGRPPALGARSPARFAAAFADFAFRNCDQENDAEYDGHHGDRDRRVKVRAGLQRADLVGHAGPQLAQGGDARRIGRSAASRPRRWFGAWDRSARRRRELVRAGRLARRRLRRAGLLAWAGAVTTWLGVGRCGAGAWSPGSSSVLPRREPPAGIGDARPGRRSLPEGLQPVNASATSVRERLA